MRRTTTIKSAAILAACLVSAGTGTTAFGSIVFTGSGTGGRAASVSFDVSGGNLVVTLKDSGTEPAPTWDSTYMLGAVFFNYTGPGSLAPNSAIGATTIGAGGGVIGTLATGTTIGSYWAYGAGLTGPKGATQGLMAVGYGVGQPNQGNMGPPPGGQPLVDGAAGGMLGWGNLTGANSSVKQPVVYSSLTFTLIGSSLPAGLTSSDFSDVSFQYGTILTDANLTGTPDNGGGGTVPAVPEPATAVAGALLLLPLGASALRVVRKSRTA